MQILCERIRLKLESLFPHRSGILQCFLERKSKSGEREKKDGVRMAEVQETPDNSREELKLGLP